MSFIWDMNKSIENALKHGVSFEIAQKAFVDNEILTVRFTMRLEQIRIIGAGYWRKGKKVYYEEQ
jgi:hypothetical protein